MFMTCTVSSSLPSACTCTIILPENRCKAAYAPMIVQKIGAVIVAYSILISSFVA